MDREISTPDSAGAGSRPLRLLRVDASMRYSGSFSRQLSDELIDTLRRKSAEAGRQCDLKIRDLAQGVGFIDAAWIAANNTEATQRSAAQQAALSQSDALVAEVQWADALVIACPMYNFGPPAALKAWMDQIARSGLTFRYTAQGPQGLLENKRAYVVISGGGVAVGSEADFLSGYLRHYLGFLGIHDVEWVVADQLIRQLDDSLTRARSAIAAIDAPLRQRATA